MQRRTLLSSIGAMGTVAIAGCSGSSSGGPFEATVNGIYKLTENPSRLSNLKNTVFVELTLEGNPDEWPEFEFFGTTYQGYLAQISRSDGNIESATILYEEDTVGWTTGDTWFFTKGEFTNDGEETERIVLGEQNNLSAPTEFTFYAKDGEEGESIELATATYEGDPEPTTV